MKDRRSAEALRHAVLALIKEKQFAHPYHWAGFIVIGTGY
jgi:CHAT domain-containing protein